VVPCVQLRSCLVHSSYRTAPTVPLSSAGAMIAGGFVANGATVYICSRKDSSRWAAELTAKGPGRCVSVSADLTEQHDIDQLLEFITGAEGKLHCLVNNSGANWAEPLPDYSITGWNKVQDLNVSAVFNLTKCALPLLSAACHENDPARVINIASVDVGCHHSRRSMKIAESCDALLLCGYDACVRVCTSLLLCRG
jgi:NAD(P)-dependent dehydrogenase (short-subunit alcohol dehydrogenase family)